MKKSSNPKRKTPTWTIQPAPDVVEAFEKLFKGEKLTRGKKTALVNEALRLKLSGAAISLQEQIVAAEQAKLKVLKGKA